MTTPLGPGVLAHRRALRRSLLHMLTQAQYSDSCRSQIVASWRPGVPDVSKDMHVVRALASLPSSSSCPYGSTAGGNERPNRSLVPALSRSSVAATATIWRRETGGFERLRSLEEKEYLTINALFCASAGGRLSPLTTLQCYCKPKHRASVFQCACPCMQEAAIP